MCLQRLITTYCNSAGQKERNERGGGGKPFKCYVPRDNEEKKTERRKWATNKARKSSSALSVLRRSVGTQRRALSFDFFFYSFPLSRFFFFLENTPKRHARDNNCVLYNRLYQHLPKTSLCSSQATNTRGKKKNIFPPPRGGEKSTAFAPQTCTVSFARLDRYNERCGVEKEQLLRRRLFENAAM